MSEEIPMKCNRCGCFAVVQPLFFKGMQRYLCYICENTVLTEQNTKNWGYSDYNPVTGKPLTYKEKQDRDHYFKLNITYIHIKQEEVKV